MALIFSQSQSHPHPHPHSVGFWVSPEIRSVLQIPEDYLIFEDPQLIQFLDSSTIEFQAAMVWVWHLDKRGVKPDRRNKLVRLQEPHGTWMYSILRLCKECFVQKYTAMLRSERSLIRTIETHPTAIYPTADHWFLKIIAELRSADLALILQTWEGLHWTKELEARSQRSLTATIDSEIRLKNPLQQDLQPNFWNLMQCAIELSGRSQDWYEHFLRGKKKGSKWSGEHGFIYAYRAFIKSLESKNFKSHHLRNVSENTKPRKAYTARVTEGNLQNQSSRKAVK